MDKSIQAVEEKVVTVDGAEYRLTAEPIEIEGSDVDIDSSCGSCYMTIEDGEVLTITECINPENEQKLSSNTLCHIECAEDTAAEMALAHTTQYYDWTSETSKMEDYIVHTASTLQSAQQRGDKYVAEISKLKHSCRDIVEEATQNVKDAIDTRLSQDGFEDEA